MTEAPRISLDIGAAGAGTAGAGADPGTRREADPGAADAFRRSLEAGKPAEPGAPAALLANPFALFSSLSSAAPAAEAPPSPASEAKLQDLGAAIERILVADGAGTGEREVRVRLKDDLLQGTEVRIVQREGRLDIVFVSADPNSMAWLVAQSEMMSRELARRLRRDVRVAVRDEAGEEERSAGAAADAQSGEAPLAGPAALFGVLPGREEGEGR